MEQRCSAHFPILELALTSFLWVSVSSVAAQPGMAGKARPVTAKVRALSRAQIRFTSTSDVKRMIAEGKAFELIDVRTPDQFKARHLAGARNIPFYELSKAVLPKDRPLVLYCSARSCSLSSDAAGALLKRGYESALILDGGLEAAVAQGLLEEGNAKGPAPFLRKTVSGMDLEKKMADPDALFVIDLRPELEFKAGHLPGALSIPLERLEVSESVLKRGRDVVVYDRIPERSSAGSRILERRGFKVFELEGGIMMWSHEGRSLVTVQP